VGRLGEGRLCGWDATERREDEVMRWWDAAECLGDEVTRGWDGAATQLDLQTSCRTVRRTVSVLHF
jgi:hypothetical protein